MNTHRMNITIPKEYAELLKKVPNKSAFITQAVKEKLEGVEREKAAERLAVAYRQAAQEDKAFNEEWDALSGDGL
ncbi:MAG: hypothetical protein HY549_04150 [Elusimicrobia bacterium]|nr:hypothetical protein [Elusimicrobiota bacterium]